MTLSNEQREYLEFLGQVLSVESLVEFKKGNIVGIKNFNTKLIDPDLINENKEMKEILKRIINKKRNK